MPSAMPGRPYIRLDRVTESYGAHTVLHDVSLSVHTGDVLAIIGPSGSGKSTRLRCINFIEPPDRGTVSVGDVTLEGERPATRRDLHGLRRNLGMVFQSFNLFPHMTVLRNITLAQERVLGRKPAEAEAVAMQFLARVDLTDKAGQYPTRRSGGQQQRVAIARALALDPKVMLFEPTSALDHASRDQVLDLLGRLTGESPSGLILISHDLQQVARFAARVLVMRGGAIVDDRPAADLARATHPYTRAFWAAHPSAATYGTRLPVMARGDGGHPS